ncbi:DUF3530 family protein [Bacterioplanoides sp. SCSIO 12839]|uniref:DUF3530 family protein n=1 Tax=Bacterioplanoides sp. SCSIO 12839 TaxID=2829569 RepID=UPI0021066814|nr:DUF3530 family protein [Bacterioplanoides sp. SCSIO 12839]UTW47537.1 DUF3530 family protein [Bacterioplanoides sp. SCSIO 12839]
MIFSTRFAHYFLLPCFLLQFALLLSVSAYGEDEPQAMEKTELEETEIDGDKDEQPTSETAEVNAKVEVLERVSPQTDHQRHQSIIDHLSLYQRQREVVELVNDDESFHGLFLQENMGQPQGGILLLHDNQQHAQWPTIVGPLRQYLPDYGWATLAIELPSQPIAQLPQRPSYGIPGSPDSVEAADEASENEAASADETGSSPAEQSSNETDTNDDTGSIGGNTSGQPEPPEAGNTLSDENNEPALPRLNRLPDTAESTGTDNDTQALTETSASMRYQQHMRNRVNTAMDYLKSRGQLNLVIIANGNSASWAVNYLLNQQQQREGEEEKSIEAFSLVLVDAQQNTHDQLYLEEQLTQLEIPILDLVINYNRASSDNSQRRAGMMRHQQRQNYRQLTISAADLMNEQHHQVKRRIRGWLKTNAAGSELPLNR